VSDPALPTVAALLTQAHKAGLDRLDAHLLLGAVLGRSRSWLIAHDTDPVPAHDAARFSDWAARRADGEPVAYLLGEKEFHGLPLQVGPGVLVPRPDTETLVDWALELIAPDAPWRVLDLGTGSGAIALAVAHARPSSAVTAVDASPVALQTAQTNAQRLGLNLRGLEGSWLAPVSGECFDLILSNPPYIAEGDPHLPALRHEPIEALTAGPDGLDDLRVIVRDAPAHLTAGGWLLLEHGHDQGAAVRDLLQAAGFDIVSTRRDLGMQERCTGGRWPGVAKRHQPPASAASA